MPLDLEQIRARREKAGLSFDAAAKAAGFKSRQTWYQIESGRQTDIKLSTLERMAEVLGTTAKKLLK